MIQRSVSLPSLVENDNEVDSQIVSKKKSRMFYICKEFCFIFALTFTAYATVLNNQTKTKKGPPPVPFFHRGSVVDDFYQGDISQLIERTTDSVFAFVLFYAPWDADSQDAREEFEQAAQFYYDKVYFAAVNCWEPGSECKTIFKDITSFPRLVTYKGDWKAIEYRGPFLADYIIKFVHSILNPVTRVNSVTDVLKLRYLHDAVVVGCLTFDGVRGGAPYNALYDTALRMAGQDFERHIVFSVFTHNKSNHLLDVFETPTVILYLWDKKLIYSGRIHSDGLYEWVAKHTFQGLSDIYSNTLLPHVKSGAVVVMFTPRHPLAFINPYYQMLRRIAMKFFSCKNSTETGMDNMMNHYLQYEDFFIHYEKELLREDIALRDECSQMLKAKAPKCTATSTKLWNNISCFEMNQYCLNKRGKYLKKSNTKQRSKMPNGNNWKTSDELTLEARSDRCNLLERSSIPLIPLPPKKQRNASGLVSYMGPSACEFNSTITFLALDSGRYSHIAQGLGLELQKRRHHTALAILTKEELLKLEVEYINEETISNFLTNFVSGEEERFLRHTKSNGLSYHPEDKRVSVSELNTLSFQRVVLNDTQTVVLLYHSPYCSFCLSVSHVFLTVAYLLRNLPRLMMTRVDGERNDLPWQYTVYSYPSIIIFPARRKSESRKFPHKLQITVHSLSQFILANLEIEERIQGMLALCGKWGNRPDLSREGDECLRSVRLGCLDAISNALKKYRLIVLRLKHSATRYQRKYLRSLLKRTLKRLQYLKSVHLNLEQVVDVQETLSKLIELEESSEIEENKKRDTNIKRHLVYKDEL